MSDTGEIVEGCLTHYDSRHIQTRIDFMGLCSYDKGEFSREKGNKKEEPNQECMAKIMRLFETLTDHERLQWKLQAIKARERGLTVPPEPKEYPLQLSYGAIVSLLFETFGESTIRNSIAHLLTLKFIRTYQEKKNSIPFYWLQLEYVQSLLKQQAEEKLSGVEINSHRRKKQVLKSTAKRPKSTPTRVEINSQTSEINTNNIYNNKDNNKDERGEKERDSLSQDISAMCETPPAEEETITDLTEKRPITPGVVPIVSSPLSPPIRGQPPLQGDRQLTLGGKRIVTWYEEKRGHRIRLTEGPILHANAIALVPDLTQEEFDTVIDTLDADKWFKDRHIGIDLEEIDKHIEKMLVSVRHSRASPPPVLVGSGKTVGGYYYYTEED